MKTKSKLNATWHRNHVMPKNPTPKQRVAWHVQHFKHCGCREMPPSIRALIEVSRKLRLAPATPAK